MKSSVPLLTRKGKIIVIVIPLFFIGLGIWANWDEPPSKPYIGPTKTEAKPVDPDCRVIWGHNFEISGAYVGKTPDEVRMANDMSAHNEIKPITKLELEGRIKLIPSGTKIQEINIYGDMSFIRLRGESETWFCDRTNIMFCKTP